MHRLRLAAYLLLGDPRWLPLSVASYYALVDRIIAVHDREYRAWDGSLLPIQECLNQLEALDVEGKVTVLSESIVDPNKPRMMCDTDARRRALAELTAFDWVLQLDADEIMTMPATFLQALYSADASGAGAMDYPSRWILGRVLDRSFRDIYLEASDALGRVAAHYPGPLAVRPGVHLNYSRRATTDYFRVDVRKYNTYHEYTRSHPVDMVVPARHAVMHLSWVDRPGVPAKSAQQHGHWAEHSLDASTRLAAARMRHPIRTVLTTPLRAGHGHPHRLRLSRIDLTSSPPRFLPLTAGRR